MVDRCYAIPEIREYLDYTLKEQVVSGEIGDVRTKGIVDATDGSTFILDLKKRSSKLSIHQTDIEESIFKYNYDSQQWSYGELIGIKERLLLFVLDDFPYTPTLVRLSPETMRLGKEKYMTMLNIVKGNLNFKTNTMKRDPFYQKMLV
jgi:hypothetical protein